MPRFPRLSPAALRATLIVMAALALVPLAARPASALRLVAYNCLNYDNDASVRDPAFRTVLSGISNVDVLAVEEIQNQAALNAYLNNVLNVIEPGEWAAAPYFDDPTMSFNQGLFYRTSTMTLVQADTLGSDPRDISWFKLRAKPYTSSGAEFVVFVCHLKASTGYETERLAETTRLRNFMNTFPAGTNMIVVGDLNLYTSTEPAYQKLLGSEVNNTGRVQDPINTPGSWHNSSTYAAIHTQSTRTGYLNPNDGGSTGGMDDRFDFILPTYSLADGQKLDQIPSTYAAYGNDGLHFNANINDSPTNAAVGQTIADALQRASDHLPVRCDFQVPAILSAASSLSFGTVIVGATAQQNLTVSNTAASPADVLDYSFAPAPVGFTVPGGSFQDAAGGGGNVHVIGMVTTTAGAKSGNLTLNSDDVDHPATSVGVSGTVLRHAVPSLASGSQVLADTLDFGSHEEGSFSDGAVSVYNPGYDALQALLNVYDASVAGGNGRFSLVGGFSAGDVGASSAGFTVHFDDTGAATNADTTYTATLTFKTRDQQGLAGATNRSDLTVHLTATVQASAIGVGDGLPALATRLGFSHPNPFQAATRIRFSLAADAPVTLTVYDIQGRVVRTLVQGVLGAGEYDAAWDGRGDDGRTATPGVYFYRLQTPDYTSTRRMIRLR